MTSLLIQTHSMPLTVDVSALVPADLTAEQFYAFCQRNPELRIERSSRGDLSIMSPAFSDTGNRNFNATLQLGIWAERDGTGEGFDSSAGFTLPNGATRSPDAAWIRSDRWTALSDQEKSSFAPICPDFVIELRSARDTLKSLKEKMEEYIVNGTRLGLLIDRKNRNVYRYRPNRSPETLDNPEGVECDPELPGFCLKMIKIW